VRDAALLVVRHRAAQLFFRHLLVGHGADDVWPRHEHVAGVLTITVKSVMAGEYTAPPAQGPMIAEICGTYARRQGVAKKDIGVAAERQHAFLDARAA
jgi:hypothetical protein